MEIVKAFRNRIDERIGGDYVFGVSSVHGIAGKIRSVAEILAARHAVFAGPISTIQPGDAYSIAFFEMAGIRSGFFHDADDLMAWDHGRFALRQFPFDNMQVRPADAARTNFDQQLVANRLRRGHFHPLQRIAFDRRRRGQDTGLHYFKTTPRCHVQWSFMASSSTEFYRIQKLPPYVFAVINEMRAKARAEGLDVIDLGMGNPDGAAPQAVVDKLVEAAQNPKNHRYSMSRGLPKLREEIVNRYRRNYGVELDPETEAIATIGAKDALAHLLFAVVGPGDTVVSPNPCYPIHHYGVIMAEGNGCMLPMPDPATFLNRLEDLYRYADPVPKMILVSFPHNPTTQCVDLQFFRDLVALAAKHGTIIVHDFAYADICFDGYKAPSILEVEGAKEIAVEIYSLSKSFNMAGWRVGFCVGNRKLIAALARIKSYLDYGIFQPIQIASIIALRECQKETEEIRDTYQRRRDVLITGLQRAGWPVESPQGSMFVWAPLPEQHRPLGSLEFSKMLMQKALVAVSPGIGFGPMGEGHVRFGLVENEHRIKQATKSIQRFLKTGLD